MILPFKRFSFILNLNHSEVVSNLYNAFPSVKNKMKSNNDRGDRLVQPVLGHAYTKWLWHWNFNSSPHSNGKHRGGMPILSNRLELLYFCFGIELNYSDAIDAAKVAVGWFLSCKSRKCCAVGWRTLKSNRVRCLVSNAFMEFQIVQNVDSKRFPTSIAEKHWRRKARKVLGEQ